MKKVIFISALAIAAAVSCTKSDIVDTKFNEQISFETYTGRDAMTKATPYGQNALPETVGVYGFYTGTQVWGPSSSANLWSNLELTKDAQTTAYTYDENEVKYWTNATDLYSFLAYAPYATETNGLEATEGANPKVTYTVDTDLEGIDLLYANTRANDQGKNGHVNMVKADVVNLQFKHALARLTVTAAAKADNQAFKFDVKEVSISGNFNTTGTLTLADANPAAEENGWASTSAQASKYKFYNDHTASKSEVEGEVSWDVLTTTAKNYADGGKYLMMIPTDFTETGATLKVVYTSIYADQESGEMTKELTVEQNFEMGKAYSINIVFDPVLDDIQFSVSVADWEETQIPAGNPESATDGWVAPTTGGDEVENGDQQA